MMKIPDNLKKEVFLSGMAGSFSGVPQRTVQKWTEDGLVVLSAAPLGTGDRRKYSILNCLEIAIVRRLAKDRVSFKEISQVMEFLRIDFVLIPALQWDFAFLVIKEKAGDDKKEFILTKTQKDGESSISYLKKWYIDTTPKKIEKLLIYNISIIVEKVLKKIAAEA